MKLIQNEQSAAFIARPFVMFSERALCACSGMVYLGHSGYVLLIIGRFGFLHSSFGYKGWNRHNFGVVLKLLFLQLEYRMDLSWDLRRYLFKILMRLMVRLVLAKWSAGDTQIYITF